MLPTRSLWSDRQGTIPTPTPIELVRECHGVVGACSNLTSSAVAMLKYSLHRGPDEDSPEVKDHPFLETLKRPNPFQGTFEFFKLVQEYLDMTGVCHLRILPGVLNPIQKIYPLQTHLVMAKFGTDAQLEGWWYNAPQPNSIWLTLDEVFPIRWSDIQNPYGGGWGPAQRAWTEICLANGDASLMYALQQNNAIMGTIITPKDAQGVVSKGIVERLTAWLNSFRGGKAGRPAVSEIPIDVLQLSQPSKDFEGSDRYDQIKNTICACFGVPTALLSSAGTRAELDSAQVQFARLAIDPRTALLEGFINRALLPLYGEEELTFHFEDSLPEDQQDQGQQIDPKTGLPTGPNPSAGTKMNPFQKKEAVA